MNVKMGIVSNISTSLLESLFEVLGLLEASTPHPPNQVKTNAIENGLSCTIIILSVTIIDSAIGRAKYVSNVDPRQSSIEYFRKITTDDNLANQMEEIYAVRDSIVHNHLWEGEIRWREKDYELQYVTQPTLRQGFGDSKMRNVLDASTRATRRQQINLVPMRIWRRDAFIVLQNMGYILLALENINRSFIYVSHIHFRYRGNLRLLNEILSPLHVPDFI